MRLIQSRVVLMAFMFSGCLVGSSSAQSTEKPGRQNLIQELELGSQNLRAAMQCIPFNPCGAG